MGQITATVVEVLFYYDGPLIVHARTPEGQDIITTVYDQNDDSFLYLGARVSPETLRLVIDDKIDFRDPFTTHRIGAALTAKDVGGEGSVNTWTEMDTEPPEAWLPAPDVTLSLKD